MKEPLIAYNAEDVLVPDLGSGRNPRGQIVAANEDRFSSKFYSEPLTAYTVGWRDPENLQALLDAAFPSVQVGRMFEFKKATNAEAFVTEVDDSRAIGAAFKKVQYSGETALGKTLNRGLTISVDHDEEVGDGWREMYVARLLQRLTRNELKRALAIVAANVTNANKTWGSSANPDADMRAMLVASADASGVYPNVILIGETARNLRLDSYEAQNTPYAGVAAGMDDGRLASKLGVDRIIQIKARYQSSATAKTALLGSYVQAFIAIPGASKDDASNFKRFTTPTASGPYRVYVTEHEKSTDITVECYSAVICTSTLGVRQLTIS